MACITHITPLLAIVQTSRPSCQRTTSTSSSSPHLSGVAAAHAEFVQSRRHVYSCAHAPSSLSRARAPSSLSRIGHGSDGGAGGQGTFRVHRHAQQGLVSEIRKVPECARVFENVCLLHNIGHSLPHTPTHSLTHSLTHSVSTCARSRHPRPCCRANTSSRPGTQGTL